MQDKTKSENITYTLHTRNHCHFTDFHYFIEWKTFALSKELQ